MSAKREIQVGDVVRFNCPGTHAHGQQRIVVSIEPRFGDGGALFLRLWNLPLPGAANAGSYFGTEYIYVRRATSAERLAAGLPPVDGEPNAERPWAEYARRR